jgi:hypothetical protein
VDYELTERAQELAPVLGELARWGYEWTWSAPRPNERVDVRALFRLLPGLVDRTGPARDLRGTVALTVADGRAGAPVHTLLTVADGSGTVSESDDLRHADAHLQGSTADWVRALVPAGDLSGLRRSGASDLVEMTFGLLSLGRTSEPLLSAGSAEVAAL